MRHTIQKKIFDLWVHGLPDALALQQRVSDRFRMDIVPELEKGFNNVSDANSTITIDRLEIDLGLITEEMIETGGWGLLFREKLEEALQESMNDVMLNRGGIIVPLAESVFSQWIYFIGHGYLPWNAARPSSEWFQQVLESLAADYDSASALRHLVTRNAIAAERIVLHHSPEFLSHLIELLTAEKQNTLPAAVCDLAAWLDVININYSSSTGLTQKAIERKIWEAILQKAAVEEPRQDTAAIMTYLFTRWLQLEPVALSALVRHQPAEKKYPFIEPVILNIVKGVLRNEQDLVAQQQYKTTEKTTAQQTAENTREPSDKEPGFGKERIPGEQAEQALQQLSSVLTKEKGPVENFAAGEQAVAAAEGIYITHAGLVLLHPFLHNFFKKLGLVKAGRFDDEAKQERAVCLLHELTASGAPLQEYELVLAKLLCGWPLHKPVDTGMELTAAEKEEAQHLLTAAIEQWEILRNTTPSALQETFLQRKGKLLYKNEKWYLQVEKRSVDVLLGHLPWMISMIRLPWMKELLKVDWT